MDIIDKPKDPQPVTLQIQVVEQLMVVENVTVEAWLCANFAPEWFKDALHEARIGSDRSASTKILFAVCAAESYIFEWVRDEVLLGDYRESLKYFPPNRKSSVKKKWKEIPKELLNAKLIIATPDWGGIEWQDFCELVTYRDGLVHASASRPDSDTLSQNEKPIPSLDQLDTMKPGWPVEVVITLVKHLHTAIGTKCPIWLVNL